MENILQSYLQEVIFSSSDPAQSKQISKLEKTGKLKKIAPRIYTSNLVDTPESIVLRNLFTILGKLYPRALLSHRSAIEFKPTSTGNIFLTYTYTKKIELPGVTLNFLKGHEPIDGDNPISGELYVSQKERSLLENLQVSRLLGPNSKIIPIPEIEEKLEQIIQIKGELGLNEFRDNARVISEKLEMGSEFKKLNQLISAILSTKPSKILSSPSAIARAFGAPYDSGRISLFEKLFIELNQHVFKDSPDQNKTVKSFRNFAFFESYFSNYIEGTEFELKDAKSIIETETPILNRNEDSHDILGTYKIVSNREEMKVTPHNAEEFLTILLYRHQVLMSARTSKNPGQFKDVSNRAGDTHFVDHKLVKGTLIKGFEYYQAIKDPFAKSAFIMFLISEVHPFIDGNGRMARVMMNAELVKLDQTRIIIPTVFRNDYLLAIKRLTRQQVPNAYINMLKKAQLFSETIVGDNIDEMEKILEDSNAFKEHDEAKLKIIPPLAK